MVSALLVFLGSTFCIDPAGAALFAAGQHAPLDHRQVGGVDAGLGGAAVVADHHDRMVAGRTAI